MQELFGPVTPVLILAAINGLVEIAKRVQGGDPLSWKTLLALGLGVFLGGGLALVEAPVVTVAVVFQAVIYGVLTGLAATGVYDLVAARRSAPGGV